MPFPERDLPKPEDRATAFEILEWAYDHADAAAASRPMHVELRHQADNTAWSNDRRAWAVVYGLALKLWEIAYTNHKRQEEQRLRSRNLF
jgi:hypothetical protein